MNETAKVIIEYDNEKLKNKRQTPRDISTVKPNSYITVSISTFVHTLISFLKFIFIFIKYKIIESQQILPETKTKALIHMLPYIYGLNV